MKSTLASILCNIEEVFKTRALAMDIEKVCQAAYPIAWARDPFDRLIVAESVAHAIPLITKDRLISQHYANAI